MDRGIAAGPWLYELSVCEDEAVHNGSTDDGESMYERPGVRLKESRLKIGGGAIEEMESERDLSRLELTTENSPRYTCNTAIPDDESVAKNHTGTFPTCVLSFGTVVVTTNVPSRYVCMVAGTYISSNAIW